MLFSYWACWCPVFTLDNKFPLPGLWFSLVQFQLAVSLLFRVSDNNLIRFLRHFVRLLSLNRLWGKTKGWICNSNDNGSNSSKDKRSKGQRKLQQRHQQQQQQQQQRSLKGIFCPFYLLLQSHKLKEKRIPFRVREVSLMKRCVCAYNSIP